MASPVEPPPPLGSWARLYAVVIAIAVGIMLLLYWFTETYDYGGPP